MSLAVRKCAASNDPRDWTYLEYWQRWGEYMPPWQYTFHLPTVPQTQSLPVFSYPAVVQKGITGLGGHQASWGTTLYITLPGDIVVPAANFLCYFDEYDPSAPPLDPMGNPFTLSINGSLIVILFPITFAWLTWTQYYFEPSYDTIFTLPLNVIVNTGFFTFDPFLTITPCIWNKPELLP